MKYDELGMRMKGYEMAEAGRMLIPLLPVMVRLDGHGFHNFTRGLKRPYDERLSSIMVDTTKFLVDVTNACVGYTQSDEISLVIYSETTQSQTFFNGRIQKLISLLAAMASVKFYQLVQERLPEKAKVSTTFDCRVWNVPNLTEAANTILWREFDASKNSISMAARAHFSHKEVDGKTGPEKQEMLFQRCGINWNDYPSFFKRGTYVQRRKLVRAFTSEEIDKLPAKHAARTNPLLIVERTEIRELELEKLSSIVNREAVLFKGEDPVYEKDLEAVKKQIAEVKLDPKMEVETQPVAYWHPGRTIDEPPEQRFE